MFAGTASHRWSLKLSDLYFQLKKSRVISALFVIENVIVHTEKVSSPCQPPKNETAFQEGCVWGTPEQRAEAPKTASHALGPGAGKDACSGHCQARWPRSYLQGCGVLEGTVALLEQFLVFVEQSQLCFYR